MLNITMIRKGAFMQKQYLEIGKIINVHGLKGEIRLYLGDSVDFCALINYILAIKEKIEVECKKS